MKRQIDKPIKRILVVDIGGSHVKCVATGRKRPAKFKSGPKLAPEQMVKNVLKVTKGWHFDAVSIGYPGVVRRGRIAREPHNLGPGWVGFDYRTALGRPVKIINDAAMQALGGYEGGKMLFLGLGTGLGSALIINGVIVAMELGHLHYAEGAVMKMRLAIRDAGGWGTRNGAEKWRMSSTVSARPCFLITLCWVVAMSPI